MGIRGPLAAAALTAAAAGSVAGVALHQSGSPSAGPVRSSPASVASPSPSPSPRPSPRRPAPVRAVVLGDSVVSGTACGCTPFGPRLARLLRGATSASVELRSLGQDGLTSDGLVAQLRQDPTTRTALRHASTVTITIGANDFDASDADDGCGGGGTDCYQPTLQGLPARLGTAIDLVRRLAGRQVQVFVTGYWNVFRDGAVGAAHGPTYERTSDTLTRQVNQRIAAVARQRHVTYVDLYGPFQGDDTRLLAADGDHPSAAGHQLIARVLAAAIERR